MYVDQHTKRQGFKMKVFNMFITAVCVIFLIKLRLPETKSLYDTRENTPKKERALIG